MKVERSVEGKYEKKASPSVASKRAAESAAKVLREARSGRMAAALSTANRKTGLFKK
jgi:hypothetical protein